MGSEWTRVPLGSLIEFTRDGEWGGERPSADSLEMLVVRGTDFSRLRVGALDEIPRRYIERGAAERKQLRAGDVLIETAGGTKDQSTGRTALVKQSHVERADLPLTCASFARFLRFNCNKVDPGFMYWWLQSLHVSGEIEMHQVQHTGVARFQFTKFVESTEAPLPPLPEQRAIAHILGTLDDKIELNRRMNETLEEIAQALFKSWFVDFDPVRAKVEDRDPGLSRHLADLFSGSFEEATWGEKVPRGFRACTWGDLVTLEYGRSLKDYGNGDGAFPVYGTNGKIGSHHEALCPHPGVIVGRKGAYRGIHFCSTPFFVIDTAFFVEPRGEVDLRWAYYELLRQDINSMDSGSAIPSTSRADFYSLPVLCPPPRIQRLFSETCGPLWARQEQNDNESRTLATLRDTLLPKLISGELRVNDAERVVAKVV